MWQENPAKDVKGFLLYSPFTRKYFFRVYNPDKTFEDYDLAFEDMEVQILDSFVALYKTDKGNKLDYSTAPEALQMRIQQITSKVLGRSNDGSC
ncbi:MAG: hypothetical protein NTX52_05255 [Planctomycetota bacterium]|nr:hypothetical protein [Planctomycetota bacterium]